MNIEVYGDQLHAKQILSQISTWDRAMVSGDVSAVLEQCGDEMSMFDVSTQFNGAQVYITEWKKFSQYFIEGMQISRRDVRLYISEDLAVLNCLSKVEHGALKGNLQMPWCRTTLCLQKREQKWLFVHQHISMPIDLETGKAIVLKDKPKLKLVI